MIKKKTTILIATCDACGRKLSTKGQQDPDGTPHGVHHGQLINHFGWGSPLDNLGDPKVVIDLCEKCYTKARIAIGVLLEGAKKKGKK